MVAEKSTVVITGGTGYVGSQIVAEALSAGYTVRALARPGKISSLTKMFPDAGSKLETFQIDDIVTGDFSGAFKDAFALIHTATPIFTGTLTPAQIYAAAVEGNENIVQAAMKAGVKKIIYTSSFTALFNPDMARAFDPTPIDENSWCSITKEEIDTSKQDSLFVYSSAKAHAEKRIWELAKEHPDVDFTTVLPPSVFGRWPDGYAMPADPSGLVSNGCIFLNIAGPNTYCTWPLLNWANVKDVARVHIAALKAPPLKDGTNKRFIVQAGMTTWPKVVEILKKERPELIPRLPGPEVAAPACGVAPYDTKLTEKVLGIKPESYLPLELTVVETMDQVLAWEKSQNK